MIGARGVVLGDAIGYQLLITGRDKRSRQAVTARAAEVIFGEAEAMEIGHIVWQPQIAGDERS